MKLQFSLATLLVCVTVLAVVTAISVAIPANENQKFRLFRAGDRMVEVSVNWPRPVPRDWKEIDDLRLTRDPNGQDIAWRLAWAAPLSIAATLGVLWAIRRLKSRRHNGPRVG